MGYSFGHVEVKNDFGDLNQSSWRIQGDRLGFMRRSTESATRLSEASWRDYRNILFPADESYRSSHLPSSRGGWMTATCIPQRAQPTAERGVWLFAPVVPSKVGCHASSSLATSYVFRYAIPSFRHVSASTHGPVTFSTMFVGSFRLYFGQ